MGTRQIDSCILKWKINRESLKHRTVGLAATGRNIKKQLRGTAKQQSNADRTTLPRGHNGSGFVGAVYWSGWAEWIWTISSAPRATFPRRLKGILAFRARNILRTVD